MYVTEIIISLKIIGIDKKSVLGAAGGAKVKGCNETCLTVQTSNFDVEPLNK